MLTSDVRDSDRLGAYDSLPFLLPKNAFVSFRVRVDDHQDIEKMAREVLSALESIETLTDIVNSSKF